MYDDYPSYSTIKQKVGRYYTITLECKTFKGYFCDAQRAKQSCHNRQHSIFDRKTRSHSLCKKRRELEEINPKVI